MTRVDRLLVGVRTGGSRVIVTGGEWGYRAFTDGTPEMAIGR